MVVDEDFKAGRTMFDVSFCWVLVSLDDLTVLVDDFLKYEANLIAILLSLLCLFVYVNIFVCKLVAFSLKVVRRFEKIYQ